MRARYSRWDATQDPLEEQADLGEVLDELAEELLSGAGADTALEALRRRGLSRGMGLDSLLQRVRGARLRAAEALHLSGPLERAKKEIDEVVSLERAELSLRDDEEARFKEALLDGLSHHPAAALSELRSYRFVSEAAAERLARLLDELRRDVLNAYFKNLAGALRGVGPAELARAKDMLADLNAMLAARRRGEDYDFEGFMSRYGELFPEEPRTLDELVDALARRMAALSRLLESLPPDQRDELASLAAAAMDDVDLDFQIQQLAGHLRELAPGMSSDDPAEVSGDGSMSMSATVDALERLGELEELEQTLSGDYRGASIDDVDEDKLRTSLGEDAVRELRALKDIERALEQAGVLRRERGRLELTARGARLLGERSLTRLLARVRREPSHRGRGGAAEETGQTRPWSFGAEEPLSVQRTVFNAVARLGPGTASYSLEAQDFEISETESRPPTATALLLDLSFSMPLGGHWVPAKRMALALHALIEGKYPQDELFLIGFSDYARRMQPAELASARWEDVHGTNMQHAFLLAGRLLREAGAPVRQVIMVTDGEPTAHLDEAGRAFFNWPPVRATVEKTLREAARLARSGVSVNIFMLEQAPGLVRFTDMLARLTGGQVVSVDSRELEDRIVGGYVRDGRARR